MTTFGLLSPNKGIEKGILAMKEISASIPDAIYIVLGQTHPNLLAQEGEKYRDFLQQLIADNDLHENALLIEAIKNICGRLVLNGVPTGVEVCQSMHHGGPFPATTDSRFTSVGADDIKRFSRPICFQNWSNDFLPDELKNENPLHIYRIVNNVLTKDPLI